MLKGPEKYRHREELSKIDKNGPINPVYIGYASQKLIKKILISPD
jgi:hypothetical protein